MSDPVLVMPALKDVHRKRLRVLQVSTYDTAGGAARPVYNLHRGLIERGHQCRMLVARGDSGDPTVEVVPASGSGVFEKLRYRIRRDRISRDFRPYRSTRPDWPERFSDDRSRWGWSDNERFSSADLLNLHWVAGFVDYRRVFQGVPPSVPVVWTLHDMNVFTGGCHYDAGCGKYKERCGACPQLGSSQEEDLSRKVWKRKKELFAELCASRRLHIVTPSHWMAGEVRESSLLGDRCDVSVIPYGVNHEEFAPRDRFAARATLGIPQESSVVLFVAYSVAARRKGFALLTEALHRLAGVPNLFLLSVGAGKSSAGLPVPQLHLGKISQDRFLSMVYSAADLFVIPSLQDNLPSTVLEAMACGTPVVGFDTGGVAEMVRPGQTGALCPVGDVSALAGTIQSRLADPEGRAAMAAHCRQQVLEEHSPALYVRRYEELYGSLTRDPVLRLAGKYDVTSSTREA